MGIEFHQNLIGTIISRAIKSIVSWYPGYEPMPNLAANFGWAKGTASHHLRINSQWHSQS